MGKIASAEQGPGLDPTQRGRGRRKEGRRREGRRGGEGRREHFGSGPGSSQLVITLKFPGAFELSSGWAVPTV